ncbi:MAG: GGDEF domain-containing protein [Motiliproteus sp.]
MSTRFPFIQQLRQMAESGVLAQLLTRRNHPFGFSDSRAEYINSRTRLLAMLFAVLTPLWIPVDYFILEAEQFQLMAMVRLIFSVLLVLLSRASAERVTFARAQRRLIALMVLPALFHLVTVQILSGGEYGGLMVFYTFLPFLIVVMHSIFPLTLAEGTVLSLLTISLLSLDELFSGSLLSFEGIAYLWLMCLLMGVAIWAQLSQLHMQLNLFNQATTDPLTGLLNRRALIKQLDLVEQQMLRNPRPVSLLLIDLDRFKSINDTHGHLAGDKVLKCFSKTLQAEVRTTDYVARFGGEEFLVVLPETRPEEAMLLAKRVGDSCRDAVIELDAEQRVTFTVSIGIGQLSTNSTVETAISHTDLALYQAKKQGRDCAVFSSDVVAVVG